jgi:hypothetical protein
MIDGDAPHPVELLRDGRGVYGIGISELFDIEAVAWSCGVEPEAWGFLTFEHVPNALILRPDWFADTKPHRAALQKISGGFRHGPFEHTIEESLRRFIHHEALNQAGLSWPPPPQQEGVRWWSKDPKQQARNRRIYHGLRHLSLYIINKLIGEALEAAADAGAVTAARRFIWRHRVDIYRAAALSRRALQLTETFPVLALAIYSSALDRLSSDWSGTDWAAHEARQADLAARKSEAAHLIDCGARLRDVAGLMNIPMALRTIKPGAAHLVGEVFRQRPDLLAFMPDTTPRQRIWLLVVGWANIKIGTEFGAWAARHVPEISGRTDRVVGNILGDLADFAEAGLSRGEGSEFITRKFVPSMCLKTVTALSAAWHEAVANNLAEGPNATFPPPWYPAATVGGYEFLPIETASELYREGAVMHHCAGTYRARVQSSDLYCYSIRRNGERVATLALFEHDGRIRIEQCRGPCNAEPPKAILTAVRRWMSAQRRLKQPASEPLPFDHLEEVAA